MNDIDIRILELTQQSELVELQNILSSNDRIDLIKILDARQYTLIHKATLNNQLQILKLLIGYAEQKQTKVKIIEWINAKTDEGFTAIHFASFRGTLPIIQYLEQCGANIYAKNNQNMNILHIAAQGDQPLSIIYFCKERNIDLNEKDNKGGTPLHWAAFLGYELTLNFLTAWNMDLNQPDNEGLTPLHLAVISGNSRVVRKLLIKGANKNINDNNGKTAANIAQENEYNNIQKMLEQKSSLVEDCCNIRMAFKPARKHKRQLFMFLFLYIFICGSYIFFTFPLFQSEYEYGVPIYIASLMLITLIMFLLSWLINPGTLNIPKKKQNYKHMIQLLQKQDQQNICPECEIIKPARSRHCEICNNCVKVYDHHCPWINNCVGAGNHRYFIVFIISVFFTLLNIIGYGINSLFRIQNKSYYNDKENIYDWFYYFHMHQNSDQIIQIMSYIFIGIDILLSAGFLVPLGILIYIQINNFLLNKTTFERFNLHATQKQQLKITSEIENNSNNNSDNLIMSQTQSQINNIQDQKRKLKGQQSYQCSNICIMCCANNNNPLYKPLNEEDELKIII